MGLLADDHRRRVVAALVLGEVGFDAVVERSGLDPPSAGRALARLVDAGLVEWAAGARLTLRTEAFAAAAVAAARVARTDADADPATLEHPDPDVARVLRAFFAADGRLVGIPSARGKRLVVLGQLSQAFEPGHRYPEREVNEVLGRSYHDTAALRRYLVDEGFLDRRDGSYWRVGGPVDVDADAQPLDDRTPDNATLDNATLDHRTLDDAERS